jgi:hypothetical protein
MRRAQGRGCTLCVRGAPGTMFAEGRSRIVDRRQHPDHRHPIRKPITAENRVGRSGAGCDQPVGPARFMAWPLSYRATQRENFNPREAAGRSARQKLRLVSRFGAPRIIANRANALFSSVANVLFDIQAICEPRAARIVTVKHRLGWRPINSIGEHQQRESSPQEGRHS